PLFRSRKANFFDMDVLFKGSIIQAFDQNYQQLWNSKHVTPIENIVKVNPNYSAFAKAVNKGEKDKNIILAEVEKQVKQLTSPDLITAQVTPVFDSLNKLANNKPYFRKRAEHQVWQQLATANKAVISTPYVVPSDGKFAFIDTLMEQKADITLMTNSSASNDSGFIPAYYEEHRQTLLDKGVHILEYKNQAKNDDHYFHSDTYYHNKTVILDDRLTYIGSSNFDPRSDFLNVELGVLIQSEAFAEHVMHYLTRQQDELFWQVSRDGQGQTQWQSMNETHTKNPNYGGWHKAPNWIFKQLNGEFEL
ncbi:phospholipase D-like domain-containing protein, partial [Vibrio genomosp. F10]|uniref:phospholipase D-like domain-containing protein n=1 Tax=Vibrio genomosp. F10 TaxID=723171 RepID=UPI001F524A10